MCQMKNKILYVFILSILTCYCFAQTDADVCFNSNADLQNMEAENIFDVGNGNKNNNTDYNAIENKIYNQLKIINEECFKILELSNDQKDKVLKLQESYMSIAKAHGILLKEAYINFNEAYKKNPNSKDTLAKKEKLQRLATDTKEDYYKYQTSLFKILTPKQKKLYNEYTEKKIKEYQAQWNHKYGKSNNKNKNK